MPVYSRINLVYVDGSKDQISGRMTARADHFMPTKPLDSQISTMEPAAVDENVIVVDIGPPPTEVAARIIEQLQLQPRII